MNMRKETEEIFSQRKVRLFCCNCY